MFGLDRGGETVGVFLPAQPINRDAQLLVPENLFRGTVRESVLLLFDLNDGEKVGPLLIEYHCVKSADYGKYLKHTLNPYQAASVIEFGLDVRFVVEFHGLPPPPAPELAPFEPAAGRMGRVIDHDKLGADRIGLR